MRRLLLLALLLAACLPAAAHAATLGGWDRPAQRLVRTRGLMTDVAGGFHGERPLSAAQLRTSLAALTAQLGAAPVDVADGPVSVVRFDRLLVAQLGLSDVADVVQQQARAAGLQPPGYFGTEVTARYLGVRFNHPAEEDALELYPTDPITRAEAAWSLAVVARSGPWAAGAARQTLGAFSLPAYTAAQRAALRIAVSKIGMPYVWGGEYDTAGAHPYGDQVHGGYDCSGFAWRVYKLSGLPWGGAIAGRTAAQQAGEVPRSARLHLDQVEPADLLFFGSARFSGRATEASVVHEGIALSAQWAIHSSGQGVYVLPLDQGWLHDSFTWARRVV
jgi:cell wall-associated NlpC family hydrolase